MEGLLSSMRACMGSGAEELERCARSRVLVDWASELEKSCRVIWEWGSAYGAVRRGNVALSWVWWGGGAPGGWFRWVNW